MHTLDTTEHQLLRKRTLSIIFAGIKKTRRDKAERTPKETKKRGKRLKLKNGRRKEAEEEEEERITRNFRN
jgi:hypothetical protein